MQSNAHVITTKGREYWPYGPVLEVSKDEALGLFEMGICVYLCSGWEAISISELEVLSGPFFIAKESKHDTPE